MTTARSLERRWKGEQRCAWCGRRGRAGNGSGPVAELGDSAGYHRGCRREKRRYERVVVEILARVAGWGKP